MEIDFGSLWTWTLPLWGLFVIILFLGGVIMKPVILEGIGAASILPIAMVRADSGKGGGETPLEMTGGGKKHGKSVRFAL